MAKGTSICLGLFIFMKQTPRGGGSGLTGNSALMVHGSDSEGDLFSGALKAPTQGKQKIVLLYPDASTPGNVSRVKT